MADIDDIDVDESDIQHNESNIVTINEDEEESENIERKNITTLLPLSRVKKICKLDPDVHMITSDSVKLITFCSERFVECLTKEALRMAKEDGRKTIQMKDVERAIKNNPLFYFLEDALSDWPDFNSVKGPVTASADSGNDTVGDDNILEEELED